MLHLNAKQTDASIPHKALLQSLDDMLSQRANGLVQCPTRTSLPLASGGRLLAMVASDSTHALVKTVTVHPDNPRFGMPRVQAESILLRADNGARIATLDGDMLTMRRTAALSVLATTRLRGAPANHLLIVGAGAQAAAHAEAFLAQGEVTSIAIYARNPGAAQQLADSLEGACQQMGVTVDVVSDLAPDVVRADVIVTATNSSEPVIPDTVTPGTMVCAVGAFTATMSELPPTLVRRSTLFVDTLAASRTEAGDLIKAAVNWDDVQELGPSNSIPPAGAPIVFKSVGCALWDLAAATCAMKYVSAHSSLTTKARTA